MTLLRQTSRSTRITMLMAVLTLGTASCDMTISNPAVLDAATFDPSSDASTLSLSAQSNFYRAVGTIIPFSAFLSQEAWVGAVRQETNDIGRRVMTAATSDVNTSLWVPLQRSIAADERPR